MGKAKIQGGVIMSDDAIVVLVTFKNMREARKIISLLLEKHLVACSNLVPLVESSFWWEGKIQKEREALAILKTKKSQFVVLMQKIKEKHSYSVPEILALPILQGNRAYLKWIQQVVI